MTRAEFLREIEDFLTASGMPATTFGKLALKDPNFVSDLRAGRAPSLTIVERVQGFIADKRAAA